MSHDPIMVFQTVNWRTRIRRALCALRGRHVPGNLLFRYGQVEQEVGQHPGRRGPTVIKILGSECQRCGSLLEPSTEQLSKFAADLRLPKG